MSPRDAPHYVALFDELRRLGFIEGQNLVVDAAGYGLPPERMEVHAADLMSGPVDVIVAAGDPAVRAAQRATTSNPILAFTDDMVGQGFVNSELVGNPAGASVSIKALELRCPSDRVRNGSLSTIGSSCQIAKFSSLLP
jgi:putative tryptophan/tyrosine transport system substrate-binding protein